MGSTSFERQSNRLSKAVFLKLTGADQQDQVHKVFDPAVGSTPRERVSMKFLSDLLLARYQVDFRSGDSGENQPIAKAHHPQRFHHNIPNADIEVESRELAMHLTHVAPTDCGPGVPPASQCARFPVASGP